MRWDLRNAWFYSALTLTVLVVVLFGFLIPYLLAHPGLATPANNSTGGGPSGPPTSTAINQSSAGTWWLVPPFIVLASGLPAFIPTIFGSISSTESFARERDKGTLSALLVQPLRRSEIVLGKFAAKVAEFLLLSTVLVVGMLVLSTVVLGPQRYADGFPLLIGVVALVFLFFAAFALMISTLLHRPRPVTLLALLVWLIALVWLDRSAGTAGLLPLAYFVPFSSAILAIPGAIGFLVAGSGSVSVTLLVAVYTVTLGQGTGTGWLVNASIGLLLGTVLCLVLASLGLSSVEVRGE